MTDPDYRVVVEVGAHTFEATYPTTPPDADGNRVTLPLTVGWAIPERTDFFPTQRNPLSGSFGLVAADLATVADLAVGDRVVVEVYVPSTDPDPWQRVVGVVTQLDATITPPNNRVQVYFTDQTWLLSEIVVGLVDWPEESAGDRLDRIAAEAGITIDDVHNEAMIGLLAARPAKATDALSAVRESLKDDADRNTSWSGTDNPTYGRIVYNYVPDYVPDPFFDPDTIVPTLFLRVFERRVTSWPAELAADGGLAGQAGVPNALDGNSSERTGKWTKAAEDRYTYVIVDALTVAGDPDAPGAVPLLRNTSFVDGPGPAFPSSTARTFLARSLVPDDSIADRRGWRTDTLRHLSYLDPVGVRGWIGDPSDLDDTGLSWARLRPTIVAPVDPANTLDGRTWIAGLLSGARLTIPPGGKFYVDLTLRPDVLAHVPTTPEDAMTYGGLAGPNFLSDNASSFETSVAAWSPQGVSPPAILRDATHVADRDWAMRVTFTGGGGTPYVRTTVAGLTIGETYKATGEVWAAVGAPDPRLGIEGGVSGAHTAVKGQNVTIEVTFTATAVSHNLLIGTPAAQAGIAGQVWLDNVRVSVADYPGAVLTWDDVNPAMTIRDLRLLGE